MTPQQQEVVGRLFKELELHVLHHGDCVGADSQAHRLAKQLNVWIVVHPPINQSARAFCDGDEIQGIAPYLTRNRKIAEEARDGLIATPKEAVEMLRSGTWATIRYARKLQRRVWIVYPNGTAHLS